MEQQFSNVSVSKKANVYFEGKCVSHAITLSDGSRKSVGVILPGKLVFNTAAPEVIEVIEGVCSVTLAGQTTASDYRAGDAFHVEADSSFTIEVSETLHYVCHYG